MKTFDQFISKQAMEDYFVESILIPLYENAHVGFSVLAERSRLIRIPLQPPPLPLNRTWFCRAWMVRMRLCSLRSRSSC
jgi:hypothetical protein